MSKLAIFGAGGAAREVAQWAIECGFEEIVLSVDDEYFEEKIIDGVDVIPFTQIEIQNYKWLVAVADPVLRRSIVNKIETKGEFITLIHPTVKALVGSHIGEGVIIAPGVTISINVRIGKHSFVNAQSIIGHDCEIGEYVTISPRAVVSGNCKVGSGVFLGANSSIREKTSISDETLVGMGAVVVNDLSKGTYVGNPARKIK